MIGAWSGQQWPVHGVAVIITAVLPLVVRNEWDLVTWLAPRADGAELTFEARTLGK